jgi:hypothetical protein
MGDRDRREDHGVKLAGDKVRTMRKEKKTRAEKAGGSQIRVLA